ncbi:thiamine pyrophosphate-binding protein [Paenibacillus thermotolerans]|uniref:thiamine pyrophosphate-binding protein n=1 Tax=Paenibacillus thermotolerans TaxID=3027807 RepID=UPI002368056B|nr:MULTISPECIES: thiamine pyrophosphate-binding protein [unclassified Paenibacillus]
MMKLSDYVIDFLVKKGISHVFEMIGGGITHLLDSIYNRDDIEAISVRHEQAGAFAAEAYARLNGKLGVAMATSGPGALNLVTGIGSCYFDSVPCLFITGQVNTYEYKFDKPVRQIGFQETDIVSVAKPLTKYAEMITEPAKIRYYLEKAVYIAQNGRPGPVLLDIPMDIQRAQIDPDNQESFFDSQEYNHLAVNEYIDQHQLNEIVGLLKHAERPVILAGGGVRSSRAVDELRELVEITGIPVVSSLMGLDAFSQDREEFFGLIGSYGNRYSNLAIANSDLIFILGSRLDSRQTGTRPDTFARAAKKIHVDIDYHELNEKVKADIAVHADLKSFLNKLNGKLKKDVNRLDLSHWYTILKDYKDRYPTSVFKDDSIDPNWFMERLSSHFNNVHTICLDVGQHQMWASQSLKLKGNQRLINSGGMGAMGFALPAAIGAYMANPYGDVAVIAGDGGIQVNIQELDTVITNNIPLKIFIMNNRSLGMVRQFQDLYFEKRRQSTVVSRMKFTEVAEAYGLKSFKIEKVEDVDSVVKEALHHQGPVLIEVMIDEESAVNPKLVVNRPIEDMYPHLDRHELKEIMLIDLAEEMEVPK